MRLFCVRRSLAVILAAMASLPCLAIHHFMQIEQVIGSVGGDTSAQAVVLRMRANSQQFLGGSKLKVYDAAGQNPVTLFDFNTSVSNGVTGSRVLLTTQAFNSLTTPNAVPDFTLGARIPDSYFAAGKLTFEEDDGTVLWAVAWGGAGYTGSNTGSTDNDADGNFGAALSASLPDSAAEGAAAGGFQLTIAASALSTTNVSDYAVVDDPTVTNNAGASFVVDGGPKSITVTQPDADDLLEAGSTFVIKWETTGLLGSKVRIDLFEDNERVSTIEKKARNKGKYRWEVPGDTPAGADYSVRVTDRETGTNDRSESFEIE